MVVVLTVVLCVSVCVLALASLELKLVGGGLGCDG